jgi:hypothetical protein
MEQDNGSPPITGQAKLASRSVGVAHMYSCGAVVHADPKHYNIVFDVGPLTNDDFAAFIEADASVSPSQCSGSCLLAISLSLILMTRTFMNAVGFI